MIQNLVTEFGYLGMFIIAFLSSSIIPLANEVFLAAMPALGYDIWLAFLAATAGNYLGSVLNYYMGYKGGQFVLSRYFKVSPERLERAQTLYERWGAPILIMSWTPFIGDPLTVVAGLFQLNLLIFSIWVILGKALRNLAVLGLIRVVLLQPQ